MKLPLFQTKKRKGKTKMGTTGKVLLGEMKLKGSGKIGDLRRVQRAIDEIQKEPITTSDEAVLWECPPYMEGDDDFLVFRYQGNTYLITKWYESGEGDDSLS